MCEAIHESVQCALNINLHGNRTRTIQVTICHLLCCVNVISRFCLVNFPMHVTQEIQSLLFTTITQIKCCENLHKIHVFRCDNDCELDGDVEAHFMRGSYIDGIFFLLARSHAQAHASAIMLCIGWPLLESLSLASRSLLGPVLSANSVCASSNVI